MSNAKVLQVISFEEATEEVSIEFRIRSDILDPGAITLALGIQPSRAFAKGEKYLSKSRDPKTKIFSQVWLKRPWGIWAIDSKSLTTEKRVEAHLESLLNILEPQKEQIKEYLDQAEKYTLSVYIWWKPMEDGIRSYELSSDFLARISSLSHFIEFGFAS
jgi:hypothetical protein